eukprot:TRINITY_DN6153_c0_g2_i2.p1 TRINITY_DN6153_c0_g2~~TRINITY_DN6153_c0_g2_i2.p1  ORF type:complete len:501 (+),score=165.61 TRINITY_DN6153_c0_g2_i2:103-1503(+)
MAEVAGADGDPPWSKCHAVTFRAMVAVVAAMGLQLSTFSGATTGVLTALETNYGLSSSTLAYIVVAYDIGAAVAGAPVGFFGSTQIPKAIGASFFVAALTIGGFGLMDGVAGLLVMQFLAGAAGPTMWVLYPVHIDNTVSCKAVASDFTGWPLAISPFGVIIGTVLAGSFLAGCSDQSEGENDCTVAANASADNTTAVDPESCEAWRVPFFITAAMMLPFALWFFASKRKYRAPKAAKMCGKIEYEDAGGETSPAPPPSEGMEGLAAPSAAASNAMSFAAFKDGVAVVAKNARLWWLSLAYAVHSFQSTAVVAFGPRFMQRQLCIKRSTATLLTATLVPVICVGVFLGGYVPKRCNWGIGHIRKPVLMMALTTWAAIPFGLVAFYATDALWLFLVCTMVFLALAFNCLTPVVTAAQRFVDEEHKGLAVGVVTVVARVLGRSPAPWPWGIGSTRWRSAARSRTWRTP